MSEKTPVTKPHLPPIEDYIELITGVWERRQLTNNGPLVLEFEKALSEYLGAEHLSLFCNGTLALISALKLFDLGHGEVITTPFTFAATSHALLWNHLKPVFVDIGEDDFNIDPSKIEEKITERTRAILAVHVYGTPCKVDAIANISEKYGLSVIYDAAHAFGVECDCGQLLHKGNASVLSLHATKTMHSVEGGVVVVNTEEQKKKLDLIRNFGIVSETAIDGHGINGKMSELHAAMGILNLRDVDDVIARRAVLDRSYREQLRDIPGIVIPTNVPVKRRNFSYFPILVSSDYSLTREQLAVVLDTAGVSTRRYFSPLLSEVEIFGSPLKQSALPVAEKISREVLCLPIYADLSEIQVDRICKIIREA